MNLAVSRLPKSGPIIISIPGISDVSVAANSRGAAVLYRWPKRYVLSGWILLPTTGLKADASLLSVAMVDDSGNQIISDGQGLSDFSNFVPSLSLSGIGGPFPMMTNWNWSPKWQPLSRIVAAGDTWQFQIGNESAGALVPFLGFRLEDPA